MVGGHFLTNPSDIATTPNDSSHSSRSNHPDSSPQNHPSIAENEQVMQCVTHHLEEVLQVMNQLLEGRKHADCRNMSYQGAAAEFSWLAGYMIKLGTDRIAGGDTLRRCIEKEKLDLIVIPEQRCFDIPETHQKMTELKSICIANKITGIQGKEIQISLNQTKHLILLIQNTGIGDMKWRNLVHCSDDRIAVIDTESFWGLRYGLLSLLEGNTFTDDARQLIVDEIAQLNKPTVRAMNKC